MATITEPTKIKLEFKEAVYMYGGDYNQGYNDGKDDGFEEGKQVGYDEGVEVGKANAPREERSVTYKANGTYQVLPSSSELLMDKVNVVVNIPDDGSYSDGYNDGKNAGFAEGEAYGKQNAPTENLNVTLSSNGSYSYPKPNDKYYADVAINVSVPSKETPTQEKNITITKNGTEVISPDSGYALDKVTVTTNIDTRLPEQTKEVTIKENGTTDISPDDGYTLSGVSVTTQIDTRLPEQEKSLEVTENKVYEVTPDDGYALKKVTVTGNVASSGGGDDNQIAKITTINSDEWNINAAASINYSSLIKKFDFTEFNKKKHSNFYGFFQNYNGEFLDVSSLDTSNATNMEMMFSSCSKLKSLDLSSFDTSKVTSMYQMFSNCNAETIDTSSFNTENVSNIYGMFSSCYKLKSADLSNFSGAKVTRLNNLFYNCSKLESVNFSNFVVDYVTDMDSMFVSCSMLASLDLSSISTRRVTSMSSIFYNCKALTDLTLSQDWAYDVKIKNLDISQSPLSKASILDVANKIADKSDKTVYTGTYTVKLKSSQKSLFTEDELTALAGQFTAKNWTLAWS